MDAWVLDTNVIVSGLISPLGPPGRIVDALLARKLLIAVDDRILQEYREDMGRPKFLFRGTHPADRAFDDALAPKNQAR